MVNWFKERVNLISTALNNKVVLKISFLLFSLSALFGVIGVFLPFVVKYTNTSNPPLYSINWVSANIILIFSVLTIYFLFHVKDIFMIVSSIISDIIVTKEGNIALDDGFGIFGNDAFGFGAKLLSLSLILSIIAVVLYIVGRLVLGQKLNSDFLNVLQSKNSPGFFGAVITRFNTLDSTYKMPFIGAILVFISLFLPFIALKLNFRIGDCPVGLNLFTSIVTAVFTILLLVSILSNNLKNYYIFSGLTIATCPYWIIKSRVFDRNIMFGIGIGFFIFIVGILLITVPTVLNYRKHNN